jgi:hypothetical protein
MKQLENATVLSNQPILLLEKASVEIADQDECQMIDEFSNNWVQAWREAVKIPKKPRKGWELHVHINW